MINGNKVYPISSGNYVRKQDKSLLQRIASFVKYFKNREKATPQEEKKEPTQEVSLNFTKAKSKSEETLSVNFEAAIRGKKFTTEVVKKTNGGVVVKIYDYVRGINIVDKDSRYMERLHKKSPVFTKHFGPAVMPTDAEAEAIKGFVEVGMPSNRSRNLVGRFL